MISALILGFWILLSGSRKKSVFVEASLFIILVIGIGALESRAIPTINSHWLFTLIIEWLFVFIALWLMEVICTGTISTFLYAVIIGAGFFYLQRYAPQWVDRLTSS